MGFGHKGCNVAEDINWIYALSNDSVWAPTLWSKKDTAHHLELVLPLGYLDRLGDDVG